MLEFVRTVSFPILHSGVYLHRTWRRVLVGARKTVIAVSPVFAAYTI